MSRKSRRNISKNARAERTQALRLPCSTVSLSSLGLSSLALGSMAFVSGVHAQDASPAKDANATGKKPKKIKREKIRYGQMPRNSLPAAPEETR